MFCQCLYQRIVKNIFKNFTYLLFGFLKLKGRNIWFSLPFHSNVKTNAEKLFSTHLQKHFQLHHRYHKSFNKSNLKMSNSCLPKMINFIRCCNTNLLSKYTIPVAACSCSFCQKSECPSDNVCLSESMFFISSK